MYTFDTDTLLTPGVPTPDFTALGQTFTPPTVNLDLPLLRGQQYLLNQVIDQLHAAGLDPRILVHLEAAHDVVSELLGPYFALADAHDTALDPEGNVVEPWLPVLPELGITLKNK